MTMEIYQICAFLAWLANGLYAANIPENNIGNNESNNKNFLGLGKKWVVLVSGSDGWNNYRHQADICHAYHIIRANGIPEENIITMMADDIAFHYRNPTPGKIINSPNGTDVYNGVVIDYSGSDVNPNNFLNVIMGKKNLLTGFGTGKVVEGGPFDKVFINFVDHGSTGLLAFPDDILWADQLNNALNVMYEEKSYSKLLMYIEACEAGSMFDGILRDDRNVFAVTASGPRESSWGCYCDKQSGEYHTCLGDLFSVTWMEDLDMILDEQFLKKQSIFKDFASVRNKVKKSNVMVYGDFSVGSNKLSSFIGYRKSDETTAFKPVITDHTEEKITMSSREVDTDEMEYNLIRDKMSSEERKELEMKIRKNYKMRSIINDVFHGIYSLAMKERPEIQDKIGQFDKPKDLDLSLDMFPCYRIIVNKISESCFSVARNPYSFNKLKIIANLCVVDKEIHKMVENLVSKVCENFKSYSITNVH